jgi:hypothetical protein
MMVADDGDAIRALNEAAGPDKPQTVLHYLYFPQQRDADLVAHDLRARGFRCEHRLGADGANWLVLARHDLVPTPEQMAATRQGLEKLAESFGGEYDGWEVELEAR